MKMKVILKVSFLLVVIIYTSCTYNKCKRTSDPITEQRIGNSSSVFLNRGKEVIVSKKNDTEIVRGFDSCEPKHTAYLYQCLRVSKDSTMLNGFFKIFYPNGKLKTLLFFNKGKQNGMCTDYWPDSTIQSTTYMYNGMFSGPQTKYDSDGRVEEVSFFTNDSQSWFIIQYNKIGDIDSLLGRPFRIMGQINQEEHVGNKFKHIIEVPRLKNIVVSLEVKLTNGNDDLIDTTISDFYTAYNTKFTRIKYEFTNKAKGKNKLKIVAKLTDSTSHQVIKSDSFSKVIMVN